MDGDPPPPPVVQDTVERFTADLAALYREHGAPSFRSMAKTAHFSKTVLNNAVIRTDRVPTEPVVREFVASLGLDPDAVDAWARRRNRLAPETRTGNGADQAAGAPNGTPARSRDRRVLVVAGALLAGIIGGSVLTFPHPVGGVDAVTYCAMNLTGSHSEHDLTWSGWTCQLGQTVVVIDMQLACRQQYPPTFGVGGGAQFAEHRDPGYTSWVCYGSLLHL